MIPTTEQELELRKYALEVAKQLMVGDNPTLGCDDEDDFIRAADKVFEFLKSGRVPHG